MKTFTITVHDRATKTEIACQENIAQVNFFEVCDELAKVGLLTVVQFDDETNTTTKLMSLGVAVSQPVAEPAPATATIPSPPPRVSGGMPVSPSFGRHEGVVDQVAKARIDKEHAVLRAAGLTGIGHQGTGGDGEQFFENGTKLFDGASAVVGKMQKDHDDLFPFEQSAEELSAAVVAEDRQDVPMTAAQFAAKLAVKDGRICWSGLKIRESALRGLLGPRLKSPALGYILGIGDRLVEERNKDQMDQKVIDADLNKVCEVLHYELMRKPGTAINCRMRIGQRDVFAVTSLVFKPADAPAVVKQILPLIPKGTKGSWSYDPSTTRWELRAQTMTDMSELEVAVGEAVSGFVSMRSADNGTSSFRGGGGIVCIRCKNCTVYIVETGNSRRRHMGKVMADIKSMIAGSAKAITILGEAWKANREVEIEVPEKITLQDFIPGVYTWCLKDRKSELMNLLPGRKADQVAGLTRAYFEQRRDPSRLVRSDLAQGLTSFIQNQSTAVRRDAEERIGAWLVNQSPIGFDETEDKE